MLSHFVKDGLSDAVTNKFHAYLQLEEYDSDCIVNDMEDESSNILSYLSHDSISESFRRFMYNYHCMCFIKNWNI